MSIDFNCADNTTLFTVIAIFLSSFLAYYFSKKRYTFEKYHDKKLETLEKIYGQVISIRQEIKKYLWFIAEDHSINVNERREELRKVNNTFHAFQRFFWEKEILLDGELVEKIEKLIAKYIEISSTSSTTLRQEIMRDYGGKTDMYLSALDKLNDFEKIQQDLKDEFRKIFEK